MQFQLTVDDELINAIIEGSLGGVERLLDAGANLDGHIRQSYRPLLVAARHGRAGGHVDILKLLIAKGADLEAKSPRDVHTDEGQLLFRAGSRALHAAVHAGRIYGRPDAVRVLLEAGADPNAKDADCTTPLFYAVGTKSGPCMVELLRGGADPAAASDDGATALHIAALHGSASMLSILLAASPGSVNVLDRMGLTPLYYAATGEDPDATSETLRRLLAAGASERRSMSREGLCALYISVQRENEAAVRVLLGHIEAVGGLDAVPLALCKAAVKNNTRLLRLLLLVEGDEAQDQWAQVAVKNARVWEPILHIAARYCSHAAVGVLLQAGADPTATNSKRQRARDVIGLAPTAEGSQRKEAAAATRRTLERGAAFGARSWAWPLATGAGLADRRPQAEVGVRVFRPRNRKFFVRLLVR